MESVRCEGVGEGYEKGRVAHAASLHRSVFFLDNSTRSQEVLFS